ncbi:MAG: TRAP transporter small permease [Synergistales bacterium]|nr:TRAP transporter small permease [Synergistales bacterium]
MNITETRFWYVLGIIQKVVMCVSSLTILTLVLVQVFLRYVFTLPIMGVEEVATLVGFWLYFMGASWGTAERSHIKADVMNAMIKNPRRLVWIKAFTAALSVVLAVMMVFWGWSYVYWGITKMQRSFTLGIPMVYSQGSIFISAILMVFYFCVEFIDYFMQAIGKKPIAAEFIGEDVCIPEEGAATCSAEE